MNEIATKSDQLPTIPDKRRRITHKVRKAIGAMVAGEAKTITDAAEKAGLSREHLSRELSKPHVATYLQEKVARSLDRLSAGRGRQNRITRQPQRARPQ
jgi:hypothetical protein